MELVSIKDLPNEVKMKLLKELGYDSDGKFVLDSNKNKVKDRYVGTDVTLSNMLILPGSEIIIDNNPLSIASYLNEFGDNLE